MKRIAALMFVAVPLAILPHVPALAQTATPEAADAETAPKLKMAAAKRGRAGADARHCLQLATNMEIHRCAEKYRPR